MSPATVTVVGGLLAIVCIGFWQRATDDREARSSVPVLLTALTMGGVAVGVTAGLPRVAWIAVALWAVGIPLALVFGNDESLSHRGAPIRCDYQSYLWELPGAIFAVSVGYASFGPSNPWMIRLAGITTVAAATASLVHSAAAALIAYRSGLGWVHYQLDADGIRFPSRRGVCFLPWASIESIGQPKNPLGLDIWFRPFTVRHEFGTFKVSRVPRSHNFNDVHRFVSMNLDNASTEADRASASSPCTESRRTSNG